MNHRQCVSALVLALFTVGCGDLNGDLLCHRYKGNPRANQICRGIQRELRWGWWGHAVPAVGWRTEFSSAGNVYCHERIEATDTAILLALSDHLQPQSQLQVGADFVLRLLGRSAAAKLPLSDADREIAVATMQMGYEPYAGKKEYAQEMLKIHERSLPDSLIREQDQGGGYFSPGSPYFVLKDGCPEH